MIVPATIRQESDRFTQEEADEIIRIARENGIELTQPMLDGLSSMYKETWILQFMKLDYGFYPAAWPLEEQAWLDAQLVSCGLREQRTRFLPAEGEISEETAIETAAAYIREAWGAGVLDGTTRYVQYMLTEDASGALCKRWDVEFEDAAGNVFLAQITPEGRVEQIINRPAEPPVESVEVPQTVSETLSLLYDDSFFTVENLAGLRSASANRRFHTVNMRANLRFTASVSNSNPKTGSPFTKAACPLASFSISAPRTEASRRPSCSRNWTTLSAGANFPIRTTPSPIPA